MTGQSEIKQEIMLEDNTTRSESSQSAICTNDKYKYAVANDTIKLVAHMHRNERKLHSTYNWNMEYEK